MYSISSNIRTNCSEVLTRKISLIKMHNCLIDLFVDRTEIDTSLRRFFDDDNIEQTIRFYNCQCLNDESYSRNFDGIDPIKENMFIPRDDAQ